MTSSLGLPPHDDDTPAQQVIALLKKVSNEELADIQNRVVEEQNRRLEEVALKLASMKETFRRQDPLPAKSGNSKSTSTKSKHAEFVPKKTEKKTRSKGTRAPRGKAKELLLAFLGDGSKGRKQIEAHFAGEKMAARNVPTLLNRLKNANIIQHDEANKLYSVVMDKNATDMSTT